MIIFIGANKVVMNLACVLTVINLNPNSSNNGFSQFAALLHHMREDINLDRNVVRGLPVENGDELLGQFLPNRGMDRVVLMVAEEAPKINKRMRADMRFFNRGKKEQEAHQHPTREKRPFTVNR